MNHIEHHQTHTIASKLLSCYPPADSSVIAAGEELVHNGKVTGLFISNGQIEAKVETVPSQMERIVLPIPVQPLSVREQWEQRLQSDPLVLAGFLSGTPDEDRELWVQVVDAACFAIEQIRPLTYAEIAVWIVARNHMSEQPFLLFELLGLDKQRLLEGMLGRAEGYAEKETGNETFDQTSNDSMVINASSNVETVTRRSGYSYLKQAFEQDKFFQVGKGFDRITVDLTPQVLSPDVLPLSWGPPAFAGRHGEFVVSFFCTIMRDLSDRVEQELKKGSDDHNSKSNKEESFVEDRV